MEKSDIETGTNLNMTKINEENDIETGTNSHHEKTDETMNKSMNTDAIKKDTEYPICSICLDEITGQGFITRCKHIFHITCFAKFIETNFEKKMIPCPNCMVEFVNIFNLRLFETTINMQHANTISNNMNVNNTIPHATNNPNITHTIITQSPQSIINTRREHTVRRHNEHRRSRNSLERLDHIDLNHHKDICISKEVCCAFGMFILFSIIGTVLFLSKNN